MKENFNFIDDPLLRKEMEIAHEVLFDTNLDLVRYMCSISYQELKRMYDLDEFSSEIHILLNYSKISIQNTEIILYYLHEICWLGFDNWVQKYIQNRNGSYI